jgi:hypothetical protein
MPKFFSSELEDALNIAFATEQASWRESTPQKPAILMRLCYRDGESKLSVGLTVLEGHGDAVAKIDQIDPGRLIRPASERHVGAIATADYWTAPEDIGQALLDGDTSTDKGSMSRLTVGVMSSGWSFEINERRDHRQPHCTVAGPMEFGKIGHGMQRALADLNERFR